MWIALSMCVLVSCPQPSYAEDLLVSCPPWGGEDGSPYTLDIDLDTNSVVQKTNDPEPATFDGERDGDVLNFGSGNIRFSLNLKTLEIDEYAWTEVNHAQCE
jgi:hypothetical protein